MNDTRTHRGDPLVQVINPLDERMLDDLITALLYPEHPDTPPVTTTQLRAALHQTTVIPTQSAYTETTRSAACPTCDTVQNVTDETGPRPILEHQQIVVTRWTRHEHPETGSVCHPSTTWVYA